MNGKRDRMDGRRKKGCTWYPKTIIIFKIFKICFLQKKKRKENLPYLQIFVHFLVLIAYNSKIIRFSLLLARIALRI